MDYSVLWSVYVYKNTVKLFSNIAVLLCISTMQFFHNFCNESFGSSIFLPTFGMVSLFNVSHSNRCSFNLHFLMNNYVKHLFICFYAICISSLVKYLCNFFCLFLYWDFSFLFVKFGEFFILNIILLSEIQFSNIFFPFRGWLSIPLTPYCKANILNFD